MEDKMFSKRSRRKLKRALEDPKEAVLKAREKMNYFIALKLFNLTKNKISVVSTLESSAEFNKKIIKVVEKFSKEEIPFYQRKTLPIHSLGSFRIRERIERVAKECARNFDGDLVEIGVFQGEMTKRLAKIAKEYNKKVIAVDPWSEKSQGRPEDFKKFLENIKEYKKFVEIIKASSLEKEVKRFLSLRRLSFAFIDGLHTFSACLSDIKTVAHTKGVIVVDDISWMPELLLAFERGAYLISRTPFRNNFCREGYLIKENYE